MFSFTEFLKEELLKKVSKQAQATMTAQGGVASEAVVKHHLSNYAHHRQISYDRHIANGKTEYDASKAAHEEASKKMMGARLQPSKLSTSHPAHSSIHQIINHPELGRAQYDALHSDSKHAAAAIVHHIGKLGSVVGAYHTGAGKEEKVKEVTGGQVSNADVVFKVKKHDTGEIEHVIPMGASLKYGTTKTAASDIKLHSPTPKTISGIIEKHHKALHGSEYGIYDKIEQTRVKYAANEKNIIRDNPAHHEFLKSTFGDHITNTGIKNKKGTALYNPEADKSGGRFLNDAALSHIRKIADPKSSHPQKAAAGAFYDDLKQHNLNMKTEVAGHLEGAFKSILSTHGQVNNPSLTPSGRGSHREISNSFYRKLINVPERRAKGNLRTLLVSTQRKFDKSGNRTHPDVDIYDTSNATRKHLETFIGNQNHTVQGSNSSMVKVGNVNASVDLRPGSRGGSINVSLPKTNLKSSLVAQYNSNKPVPHAKLK